MSYKTKDEITKAMSVFKTKNGDEYKIWLTCDPTAGTVHVVCTDQPDENKSVIVGTFKDSEDGNYEFILGCYNG